MNCLHRKNTKYVLNPINLLLQVAEEEVGVVVSLPWIGCVPDSDWSWWSPCKISPRCSEGEILHRRRLPNTNVDSVTLATLRHGLQGLSGEGREAKVAEQVQTVPEEDQRRELGSYKKENSVQTTVSLPTCSFLLLNKADVSSLKVTCCLHCRTTGLLLPFTSWGQLVLRVTKY